MMVICDACGHLVNDCDTLLINELFTCEDCFVKGGVWPQGVSETEFCFSCGEHSHEELNGLCLYCAVFTGIYHLRTQLDVLRDASTLRLVSFAALLNLWRGLSLEEVGLAKVRGLLLDVTKTGQLRALADRTGKMLDKDPNNEVLRYLLVLSRAKNTKDSDSNLFDEIEVLLRDARSEESKAHWLGFELMKDISGISSDLAARVASAMMTDDDGLPFSRRILAEGEFFGGKVRLIALNGIASNVAETVSMSSRYYNSIPLILLSGAMNSTLDSVLGISEFYSLDPSGVQNDR